MRARAAGELRPRPMANRSTCAHHLTQPNPLHHASSPLLVRARPQLRERDRSTVAGRFSLAALDKDEFEEVAPFRHLLGRRGAGESQGLDGGDEVRDDVERLLDGPACDLGDPQVAPRPEDPGGLFEKTAVVGAHEGEAEDAGVDRGVRERNVRDVADGDVAVLVLAQVKVVGRPVGEGPGARYLGVSAAQVGDDAGARGALEPADGAGDGKDGPGLGLLFE